MKRKTINIPDEVFSMVQLRASESQRKASPMINHLLALAAALPTHELESFVAARKNERSGQ